jgi:hypothetical protein
MDIHKIASSVEAVAKGGLYTSCRYCGEETLSSGEMAICTGCENILTYIKNAPAGVPDAQLQRAGEILKYTASGDFRSAADQYSNSASGAEEPQFIYAEALFYIRYSNHETGLISHELHGFMEDNISHRDAAAKLYSTAKLKLNKAIYQIGAERASGAKSILLDFTEFLSHIKLGNVYEAKSLLDAIKAYGNEYVYRYALTSYAAQVSDFSGILANAEFFGSAENFSMSGLYYVLWALFKTERKKDARVLAEVLHKYMKSESLETLIPLIK